MYEDSCIDTSAQNVKSGSQETEVFTVQQCLAFAKYKHNSGYIIMSTHVSIGYEWKAQIISSSATPNISHQPTHAHAENRYIYSNIQNEEELHG